MSNIEVGKEYGFEFAVTGGSIFVTGIVTYKDDKEFKIRPTDESTGISEITINLDSFKEDE